MINIYLCDDDNDILCRIRTALERKICVENYDMQVACAAATAEELLCAIKVRGRGIYFLDVDLKDGKWDGFRLGQEIRRRDPHGTLVYVTGYGDLAWRTFQYHLEAFDYIIKEAEQTGPAAARCLAAIHDRLLSERQDPVEVFSFRAADGVRHVPLSDILFFETAPTAHHVWLHTPCSRMEFVGSISELEAELGERFVRIHRGYLAAYDRIESVDLKGGSVLVGGRTCLLSRSGKGKLRKLQDRG